MWFSTYSFKPFGGFVFCSWNDSRTTHPQHVTVADANALALPASNAWNADCAHDPHNDSSYIWNASSNSFARHVHRLGFFAFSNRNVVGFPARSAARILVTTCRALG